MPTAIDTYRTVSQQEARDHLVEAHLPFARHILGKLIGGLPPGIDEENLEGAALLGLVEAAQQFDHQRGTQFSSFAYPRIRGAILDELRRNSPLPQAVLQKWSTIREACERLPPPVTPELLALATGLEVTEIEDCLAAIRLARPEAWNGDLHESAGGEAETSDPGRHLEEDDQRGLLADAIEALPPQKRTALTLYYLEDLRMREIGEVMGLSESRVSRLIAAAELELKSMVQVALGEPVLPPPSASPRPRSGSPLS